MKMKKILPLVACVLASVYGCKENATAVDADKQKRDSIAAADSIAKVNAGKEQVRKSDEGLQEIVMEVKNNKAQSAQLQKKAGEKLLFSFESGDAKSAMILLRINKDGNLRVGHIIYPDGTEDGPFSQIANIELTQKGKYKFVASENNMEGEPYEGTVTAIVELQ